MSERSVWRFASRPAWLLVFVLILGLALRLWGLEERSLWFDEAFSWMLADQFSASEMISRTARDVHPPLYYAVLRLWVAAFGTSVLAMRLLSVGFALLTVLGLYLFCRKCFAAESAESEATTGQRTNGSDIGLIAAGACAVSAFHIHWSHEARMYTLATTLAVLSAWALLRALQAPAALARWALYAAAATCFLYTHNYALFTVFGQGVFTAARLWFLSGRSFWSALRSKGFWHAAAAFTVIVWAYAPWIPVLLFQKSQVQQSYWIGSIRWWTIPECWFHVFFPENDYVVSSRPAAFALSVLLMGIVVAFACTWDWRRHLVLVHALVPVLCSALVSLTTVSITEPRHFMFSYLFVLCIVAALVCDASRGAWRYAAFAWVLVSGVAVEQNYHAELNAVERPGVRGAVEEVLKARKAGDRVLVQHPCVYFSAKYYLQEVTEPKLYLPTGTTLHFTGGPILRASDIVGPKEVKEWTGENLWVLDTSGFNLAGARYALPSEWIPVAESRRTFRDVYFFQKDVFVTRYVHRAGGVPNLASARNPSEVGKLRR